MMNKPRGFYSSHIAAATGMWAGRPILESERLLRAIGRHNRKMRFPHLIYRLRIQNSPRPPSLVWHHVAVRHLNDAAIARRRGNLDRCRYYLEQARAATLRSKMQRF